MKWAQEAAYINAVFHHAAHIGWAEADSSEADFHHHVVWIKWVQEASYSNTLSLYIMSSSSTQLRLEDLLLQLPMAPVEPTRPK